MLSLTCPEDDTVSSSLAVSVNWARQHSYATAASWDRQCSNGTVDSWTRQASHDSSASRGARMLSVTPQWPPPSLGLSFSDAIDQVCEAEGQVRFSEGDLETFPAVTLPFRDHEATATFREDVAQNLSSVLRLQMISLLMQFADDLMWVLACVLWLQGPDNLATFAAGCITFSLGVLGKLGICFFAFKTRIANTAWERLLPEIAALMLFQASLIALYPQENPFFEAGAKSDGSCFVLSTIWQERVIAPFQALLSDPSSSGCWLQLLSTGVSLTEIMLTHDRHSTQSWLVLACASLFVLGSIGFFYPTMYNPCCLAFLSASLLCVCIKGKQVQKQRLRVIETAHMSRPLMADWACWWC